MSPNVSFRNQLRNDFKKHIGEFIIIGILLVIGIIAAIIVGVNSKKGNFIANVYHKNEVVMTIDLSKEKEESRLLSYTVSDGDMVIEVKKNAIRIKESPCPNKDCVNTGWITDSSKPIICLHYQVCIELINSNSSYDVVI